jgi:hypothetical protein
MHAAKGTDSDALNVFLAVATILRAFEQFPFEWRTEPVHSFRTKSANS